jgi:cytidine deaminase
MVNESDRTLIAEAREIIAKRFKQDYHHVGAALITRSGKRFSAVHLEAYVGRIAVCAEAIAIGMAAVEGDTDIETIVAVDRRGQIVTPCGMCRELISDYSPTARVIISSSEVVPIGNLLPYKYTRFE